MMSPLESIKTLITDVPDFPKKGIIFKDITPILEDAQAFQLLIQMLCKDLPDGVTKLVGIESRGFILASAMAAQSGVGLALARKPGKLPRPTLKETYELEYGTDQLELHQSSLTSKDQVVIVDDILATGGTAQACEKLCQQSQAQVLGCHFLMELEFLKGRQKLSSPIKSLYSFN